MTTIYVADRVWTGSLGSSIDRGAVAVADGLIAWVGPEDSLPAEYAAAERCDYGDATILPGLIESHAHLCYDGSPGSKKRTFDMSAPRLVAHMLKSARELLAVGVTTVRDLGARDNISIEARDIVAEGLHPGPRILVAGAQITTTGGHTWQNHGAADSEDEARLRVRLLHRDGVDLIKVNATGGFMTAGSVPSAAQFSVSELRAIVDEAHRLGKKVAAHAHGVEGIERAVEAGVDSLEHCTFVGADRAVHPDPALIAQIAAKGIFVCPTATWNLPRMMRDSTFGGPPVAELFAAGVRLIAGNDAGIDGVPHAAYVGGLETMTMLGVPHEEVLVAATSRAALALGVDDVTGSLAAGLAADLVISAGNPVHDVTDLRDLKEVIIAGETVMRVQVTVPARDPEYPVQAAEGESEART